MRYVYAFDEDSGGGRELLGGKGIGLAEMTGLSVPVPTGFTITTDVCRAYMAADGELPPASTARSRRTWSRPRVEGVQALRRSDDPLLVSVRSGAPVSMPGMMDTILNVGLTDATPRMGWRRIGEKAALDSYRRLIQMLGVDASTAVRPRRL